MTTSDSGVILILLVIFCSGLDFSWCQCVSDCSGITNGDYQSCLGCNVYATCSNGILYDNRPCPSVLVWDDNVKRCEFTSATCAGPPPVVIQPGQCVSDCSNVPNGDYQSCNGCNVYATCSNGILYDDRPCPANLVWNDIMKYCDWVSPTCPFSSCYDAWNSLPNPQSGVHIIEEDGNSFCVYCEFFPSHIYTYIAPTDLTTINIDDFYNNQNKFIIRHQTTTGDQLEATIGQISTYADRDISFQYNSNVGYNGIQNTLLGPYLYAGLLPIAGITHLDDTQGYSVFGTDYTFSNCDANPNSYFVLLFNKDGNSYSRTGNSNTLMSRWETEAIAVTSDRNLPDKFFSQFELHFGGCGGFASDQAFTDVTGMTIGLRYDIPYSSCADVCYKNKDAPDGVYTLQNAANETYHVYCEFSPSHIYTYIAPTDLTTINIDDLYNNQDEFIIRHQTTTGDQLEATIGQISTYADRDISFQYNSNVGYNGIQNTLLGPYFYVGLLPIAGITHLDDTQGYSVFGTDYTFSNCDANPNSYFVLLFNKDSNSYSRTGNSNTLMSRWETEAIAVTSDRNLPDKFFSQFELHFGGCGGFASDQAFTDVTGMTIGIKYDIPYTSCYDVFHKLTVPPNGTYKIDNGVDQLYHVYCEFFSSHIYTYIAPTDLTTINIDDLYNNQDEFIIRHQTTTGDQLEATIGQISTYADRDISFQYNSNVGYNGIQNTLLGPYLYVGLLPIAGITHLDDTQGYNVFGTDYTFSNCDANPNSYFVLLFNKDSNSYSRTGNSNTLMSRWETEAIAVTSDRNLPDKFFSQFELHFGGCGGFASDQAFTDVTGMTIGLRYDFTP